MIPRDLEQEREEDSGWGSWGAWSMNIVSGVSQLAEAVTQSISEVREEEFDRQSGEEKQVPPDGEEAMHDTLTGVLDSLVQNAEKISTAAASVISVEASKGFDVFDKLGSKTCELLGVEEEEERKEEAGSVLPVKVEPTPTVSYSPTLFHDYFECTDGNEKMQQLNESANEWMVTSSKVIVEVDPLDAYFQLEEGVQAEEITVEGIDETVKEGVDKDVKAMEEILKKVKQQMEGYGAGMKEKLENVQEMDVVMARMQKSTVEQCNQLNQYLSDLCYLYVTTVDQWLASEGMDKQSVSTYQYIGRESSRIDEEMNELYFLASEQVMKMVSLRIEDMQEEERDQLKKAMKKMSQSLLLQSGNASSLLLECRSHLCTILVAFLKLQSAS